MTRTKNNNRQTATNANGGRRRRRRTRQQTNFTNLNPNVNMQTSGLATRNHQKLHAAVCSITDPFCEHAKGARMFDRAGSRTVGYQIRQQVVVNTVAGGGYSCCKVRPSPNTLTALATSISSGGDGTPTFATPDAWTNYGTLDDQCQQYRIVTFGVRIMGNVNMDASSGFIRAQTIPDGTSTACASSLVLDLKAERLQGAEITWIAKPQNDNYLLFQDLDTDLSGTWPVLQISTNGAAGADIAQFVVDIVMNIEFIPKAEVAALAKPALVHNPYIEAAANAVHHASQFAWNASSGVVSGAIGRIVSGVLGSAIGGPAVGALMGPTVPMIMDLD